MTMTRMLVLRHGVSGGSGPERCSDKRQLLDLIQNGDMHPKLWSPSAKIP